VVAIGIPDRLAAGSSRPCSQRLQLPVVRQIRRHRDKQGGKSRIELGTCMRADVVKTTPEWPGRLVGSLVVERVEDINDCHQTRDLWNFCRRQSRWITTAIPALVMKQRGMNTQALILDAADVTVADHSGAKFGMRLQSAALMFTQGVALIEQLERQTAFADVVQLCGERRDLARVVAQVTGFRQFQRQPCGAMCVSVEAGMAAHRSRRLNCLVELHAPRVDDRPTLNSFLLPPLQ
jgi:hypothetical protein